MEWPITVYWIARDNVCRGDIRILRSKQFPNLVEAMRWFPDITDPLKYWWQIKNHVITSWDAVDYLQSYAD